MYIQFMVPFYLHGGWNSGIWAWKSTMDHDYIQCVSNLIMFHNIIKKETSIQIMCSAWNSMLCINIWYVHNLKIICVSIFNLKKIWIYLHYFLFLAVTCIQYIIIYLLCVLENCYILKFFPKKLKIEICLAWISFA